MLEASAAHPGHHAGVALHPAHRRQAAARSCSHVKTVIVDEIHAVADDKRGAHLTLSLERLDLLANRPTRIGLSATQKPLEACSPHFLTGAVEEQPFRAASSALFF